MAASTKSKTFTGGNVMVKKVKVEENYDGDATRAAGERLLPHSVEHTGKIGERFAADMEKQFGPTRKSRDLGLKPLGG